jgi:hypothetical protein
MRRDLNHPYRHRARSEAIQNLRTRLDCFVAIAPRKDDAKPSRVSRWRRYRQRGNFSTANERNFA